MGFQRARSEEQILERKKEIIDAAAKIYSESGYEGLTFSSISDITAFTRPTIYKYFNTKDEILLEILVIDIETWITQLMKSFKINKLYSLEEIADIWVTTLNDNSRLIELYSILFTLLERNTSVEALKNFKVRSMKLMLPFTEFISQLFPKASNESIFKFITTQLALTLGLYPMCHLTENQKEAIKLAGINYLEPDFTTQFKSSIYQLMYCLENGVDIN